MFTGILYQKSGLFLGAISILTFLHAHTIQNSIIGGGLLLLFIIFAGIQLGPKLINDPRPRAQYIVGILLVIALISIFGSAIYYTLPSTKIVFSFFILVFGLFLAIISKSPSSLEQTEKFTVPNYVFGLIAIFVLSIAAWWFLIPTYQITESIRSVWHIIPPATLLILGVSFFTLGHLVKNVVFAPLYTAILLFSSIVIAAVSFPLGYGFDAFIHRTTVQHILNFGTITPKPFYYIGQYALELTSSHVFSIPLHTTDTFLVPVLAGLFLSSAAWIGFSQLFQEKYGSSMLALFFLPLGIFITTTPQALSYIFTISLLLLSLPILAKKEHTVKISALIILALATVVTHPLAGIPILIYTTLLLGVHQNALTKLKPVLIGTGLLLGSIALPLVFLLQAKLSGLDISINLLNLFSPTSLHFQYFFSNNFSPALDGLYLIIDNIFWITLALSLGAIVYIKKERAPIALYLPFAAACMWFINYWLLSTTLEFSFLIEYERQNYSERLYIMTLIFLIPYVGIAFAAINEKMKKNAPTLRTAWILVLTVVFLGQVYGAYPRHDGHARSAGFNVSEKDFDTVHTINQLGGEDDYIVLANQAVSAAALESFGFKKYYHEEVFYYPIPTGGELYQVYLEMTDLEPTRERAEKAMDLAGVDIAYFVVNEYWWESSRIIEFAKQESNSWFSIGEGALTVFTYERDTSQ